MSVTRQEALDYHSQGRPGKIAIRPTKPLATQRDLSLAYTPGVAQPVLDIADDPNLAYEYTAKGNLVAVISNGTAILGLGNLGPLASKPVMEGKGVLFKAFADIDVFDIELDVLDPDLLIQVVAALAPTFGGINLEDIKAPECFHIETRLKEMLDIPVFHDDQHGTAIIASAALMNALEVVGKDIQDVRIVVSGAGASAISCSDLALKLGVRAENLTLVDSRGVVQSERQDLNEYKARFAHPSEARDLADAMRDADVFYGLSVANVLTPEMVKTMADRPIIFALANPDPEIRYELAKEARPDAIVATGRSDYPNQINNVLGFPFIFRGALDVRARAINDEMKIAAAHSLAELAKQDVPDSVLHAYNLESLRFGVDYLIPKPFDPRVLLWEAPAVARAAMETGASRIEIDLDAYRDQLALRFGEGQRVRTFIMNKARAAPKRVVFGEGDETRIIRAAAQILEEKIAEPILLGDPDLVAREIERLGLDVNLKVINPREENERLAAYADTYSNLRQRKGMTPSMARQRVKLRNVFGPMMVHMGDADAFISGLTFEYPDVIRPALEIFHTLPGTRRASGVYLMIANDRVYIFTDATVNIDPSSEDLAEIAILAADFASQLELEPRVAFLSFSNFGSTRHPLSEKVRRAVHLARERRPDLMIDGEMQADSAVVPEIIDDRYPFSQVRDANVLVFPSLEAANIAYKLLDHLGNAQAIGPILLGLGAPVHVLQTGAEVEDIVHVAAIATMDAQARSA